MSRVLLSVLAIAACLALVCADSPTKTTYANADCTGAESSVVLSCVAPPSGQTDFTGWTCSATGSHANFAEFSDSACTTAAPGTGTGQYATNYCFNGVKYSCPGGDGPSGGGGTPTSTLVAVNSYSDAACTQVLQNVVGEEEACESVTVSSGSGTTTVFYDVTCAADGSWIYGQYATNSCLSSVATGAGTASQCAPISADGQIRYYVKATCGYNSAATCSFSAALLVVLAFAAAKLQF